MNSFQPDILHPLVLLEWEECKDLPLGTNYAQAVWFKDGLYIGAMLTEGTRRDHARLYIYSPSQNSWNTVNTPVYYFAMTTYRDQLVIVNGRKFINNDESGPLTDKVLTMNEDLDQWEEMERIPHMNTKRCATSVISVGYHLIVAGGYIASGMSDIVEVFEGHQWVYGTNLPVSSVEMKSVVHDSVWYLMGGRNQKQTVFCTSLKAFQSTVNCANSEPSIVWKNLGRQLLYERSSPAIFGNRLVAIGGRSDFPGSKISTLTIHAYSPSTNSWIHVGDLPQRLHSSCTVVLPSGELMVIGGMIGFGTKSRKVYKSTFKVDLYDPDSDITVMALTKLEKGPEQISLKSVLNSENMIRFLREAGISYNALMTKKFKVDSNMDISTFSIESWISGQSHFAPTWHNLFEVMKNIEYESKSDKNMDVTKGVSGVKQKRLNLKTVAEDIEDYLKEIDVQPSTSNAQAKMWHKSKDNLDENEKKHVDTVLEAMEKNGIINRTIIQGIFVGPARSGKNCLMNRLLRRIPSRVSPSTGVADSVIQVTCRTKGESVNSAVARIDGSKWTVMDDDDQAVDFMQTVTRDGVDATSSHVFVVESNWPIFQTHSAENSHSYAEEVIVENMPPSDSLDLPTPSTISPGRVESPKEIFSDVLKRKGLSNSLTQEKKSLSLYLTNTGGQVEFQDVLPLLVSGPSIFFYTFRLDKTLNDKYEIRYELSDGTKSHSYTSSLTTLEGIIQTLASIDAMITYIYQGQQKKEVKPKVLFVGTHKDKLDSKTKKETLASIDQQLRDAVFPFRSVVEFASEEQLIFTVNNFSESDSDFHAIRLRVDNLMKQKQYLMTFPSNWLAFSFILKRLKNQVISFDQCFNLAKQNMINTKEDLKEILHFLHSTTGMIRYFPYSDTDSIVVIHPQFLFDKVTELIIGTFTFEKGGYYVQKDFKHNGIFSLTDFEKISTEAGSVFNNKLFGKMLERLRIAAPFTLEGEKKYFLPCVLGHADPATIKQANTDVPTLMVTFECGYCPKGLAGALINYLMTNEMNSSFHWELVPEEIFRDQASFHVGPYDTVVIGSFATHIEINCIPDPLFTEDQRKDCAVTETCSEVCKAIEAGISRVLCDMLYMKMKHSFTFPCVAPGCNGHPAQLRYHNDQPRILYCKKMKKRIPLPANYEAWCLGFRSHASRYVRLTEKNLKVLTNQLSDYVSQWYLIGIQLGFRPGELDNIEASPTLRKTAPLSWLNTMLCKWFQWVPGDGRDSVIEANLEELKAALRSRPVGLGAIARDLHV